MIANYLRLIIFALGLLVGVQVPGFVDQYGKRVSAHHAEIVRNFAGFQDAADRYFGGNVEALIAHHAASTDAVFKDEARTIRKLYERLIVLTAERAAMSGSLLSQVVHVVFRPNREILDEAAAEYTYTVPLNGAAIVSGVAVGTVLALLVEAFWSGLVRTVRPRRHRPGPGSAVR